MTTLATTWFHARRIIAGSAKSLWLHRLRSFLTTLGIIFGVASVIAMLAIGQGASREAQRQIAQLGSHNIILETIKPPQQSAGGNNQSRMLEYGLRYDDLDRIRNSVPGLEQVVPIRVIDQQAYHRNREAPIQIVGTTPDYAHVSPIHITRGRFLCPIDITHQAKVCVLDAQVANRLFVLDDPIGQPVKIRNDYYTVVGMTGLETTATATTVDTGSSPPSPNATANTAYARVFLPITAVRSRFGEVAFQGGGGGSRQFEKVELQQIIVKLASQDTIFAIRELLQTILDNSHKKNDYKITVPLALIRQAAKTRRLFSIVLGSIAGISLLVGGIGIMNIMLATVSERTREIGIRRALGARRVDIIIQFLGETVLLTLFGGLCGILLGVTIPFAVSRFAKMPTEVTSTALILAFGISAIIGLAFGIYPAWRAANMDPIESLRHE